MRFILLIISCIPLTYCIQDEGLKDISPGLAAILEAVQDIRIARQRVRTTKDSQYNSQYKVPNLNNQSTQQVALIQQYRAQGWQ